MPLLFSYGTLQQEDVQRSTFARTLSGNADTLVGFELSLFEVLDPAFVASSGKTFHNIVRFTGNAAHRVNGTALEVTESELASADTYEPEGYKRIAVTLASGKLAWVYADARYS